MSSEGNIKASILLILLKCIVEGYSNGKERFTGRLFSNYGPLNVLFHFFWYLIYSVFVIYETFVNTFMKKTFFFSSNFKNPFQDVVCDTETAALWISWKLKSWKLCPFLGLLFQKKKADILNFSWIKYFR